MERKQSVILGINHQFLCIDSMTDARAHTASLKVLARNGSVDALDCWVWPSNRAEEIRILRDCGKVINYNVGDRAGEEPLALTSPDDATARRSMDTMRREIDMALECGARKIIIGSGPNFPLDREGATQRFFERTLRVLEWIPRDVWLTLEPTDTDIDKKYLFGPLEDTNALVARVRERGWTNFGVLLDMGHIPLLKETIPSAAHKLRDTLMHVHLGNCVIADTAHPLYGDKHPAWDEPGGEYAASDAAAMLAALKEIGYIREGERSTLSFEMRPLRGKTPEESLTEYIRIFDDAWDCVI